MSNKKQTAVEWLESFMLKPLSQWPDDYWEQAKEMEREQTMDAYKKGYIDGECNATDITILQRNL